VDRITLKALLRPQVLGRLGPDQHSFCATPDCPIVYFWVGEAFRQDDLAVRVFQKEAAGARIICDCLEMSEDQLRREIGASGASAAVERIRSIARSESCACEVTNPQGSCCLGNVMAVVRALRLANPSPASAPTTR
jgi:hypothetical protein